MRKLCVTLAILLAAVTLSASVTAPWVRTYDGNRIVAVSDRAPATLLENALDFREYSATAAVS